MLLYKRKKVCSQINFASSSHAMASHSAYCCRHRLLLLSDVSAKVLAPSSTLCNPPPPFCKYSWENCIYISQIDRRGHIKNVGRPVLLAVVCGLMWWWPYTVLYVGYPQVQNDTKKVVPLCVENAEIIQCCPSVQWPLVHQSTNYY